MAPDEPQGKSLTDRLWGKDTERKTYHASDELYYKLAIEQYKLYVTSAEHVSNRRILTNTFFVSVQTALITLLALAYGPGWHFEPWWGILFPLAAGLVMCLFWYWLILSHRRLNNAKFKVIDEYERRLPTAPFVETEWQGILAEGKRPRIYQELTSVEKYIPIVFAALYIVGAIGASLF